MINCKRAVFFIAIGLISFSGPAVWSSATTLAAAAANTASTDPVDGLDCNCTKTGNYTALHRGVNPSVTLETVDEGVSPNEIYRIITGPNNVNIYENEPGGALILQINGIPDQAGWGFSPDDHRFVYHFISAGQQNVELYDLRQRPVVMVKDFSRSHVAGDTYRIRFSPKGGYLFYMSVTPAGENAVGVVDTTGALVHETTFSPTQGAGLEDDTFHNSSWNFSRDDHNRTLVYGWTTGQNSIGLRAVNLAAGETITDLSLPQVYSSFWRFSSCGDVLGLYIQEAPTVSSTTPNPVRIQLYRTRDGHQLYNDTFSSLDFTVFSSDESSHIVTFGLTPHVLAPNTAATACATDPDPVAELESLNVSPPSLAGGEEATGTVVLTLPAPQGGLVVNLSSNRDAVSVPSSVTVPADATQANFAISTSAVSESVTATITATAGGTVRNRNLTIHPPSLQSIWMEPDSVYGGNSATLWLELNGPAPPDGVSITLESNAGDLLDFPESHTIWWGNQGSVRFDTRGVADVVSVEIQATLVNTHSVNLHILPAELHEIRYDFEIFSPCVLRWADQQAIGGRPIGFRVILNGEAPPGGAVIALTSSDAAVVTPPSTIQIGEFERSALFEVITAPVTTSRSVPFHASYRQRSLERGLTLVAPPLQYHLQDLKLPGTRQTSPIAINNLGQILLFATYDHEFATHHLWENGQVTDLHFPAPEGMRAVMFDFNDRGQYAGIMRESIFTQRAAVWEDGVRRDLRLSYGADPSTLTVAGINNRGQVAGSYVNTDQHRAVVRWTGGQPEELTKAGDMLSAHYILITKDINDAGRIAAGGWRYSSVFQLSPFIAAVVDDNMVLAPRAIGAWPDGTHINNHNTWTGGNTQIFRTDDELVFTEIRPPVQTFQQYPEAINDREEIVGYAQFDNEMEGYSIWQGIRVTAEGTWPLECLITGTSDIPEIQYGRDINNAGMILAESWIEDEHENRQHFSWLLIPDDIPRAGIQVSKTASAMSVTTGQEITYSVSVANEGPDSAEDVRLTISIPPNQRIESVESASGACHWEPGAVHCELPALSTGSSMDITVAVAARIPGKMAARSVAFSSTLETDPATNRTMVMVEVQGGDPVHASAGLDAGQTGELDLTDAGAVMDVTEGSTTSGTVDVTMHHDEPDNSQDLPLVTIQAAGSPMEPDSVLTGRFWTLEATDLTDMTYTLCLNITGLEGVNPDYLVITKRAESSQPWTAHNSFLRMIDNALYLCTADLTGFSQLGIATETGTFAPLPDPVPMPQPVATIYPEDGELLAPYEVAFSWDPAAADVLRYQFQLTLDESFLEILIDSMVTSTSITLDELSEHTTHWWRVRAENATGWGPFSTKRHFITAPVGAERSASGLPERFELLQNYPNPFNPITRIRFAIPEAVDVRLEVFNVLGQRIAVLEDGLKTPGWHEVIFDASDVSSGFYIYRIRAGSYVETRRMMLVK